MIPDNVKQSILKNGLIVFSSDYGKKGVEESWTVRLSKQIKKPDQFKEYQNINLVTGGDSLIIDIDLDCAEANKLADAVMDVGPSPCMKFNCPNVEKCKTESVECKAFRFWVNNGALETYSKKEGGMVSIEKDVGRILRIIE